MGGRLFRFMFENISNAIVMTGCTWDRMEEKSFLYLYSSANSSSNRSREQDIALRAFKSKTVIGLFVLGSFSVGDIRRLLHALGHNKIKMAILPYIMPEQREQILQSYPECECEERELWRFIKDPDRYMRAADVEEYYFIHGNGSRDVFFDQACGVYFEKADMRIQTAITLIEGKPIPVRKAGYIIQNQMLFYFSDCENMFGNTELALFCMPLENNSRTMDSVWKALVYDSEQICQTDISVDDGRCSIGCLLYRDHDTFCYHRQESEQLRMGVLMSGNLRTREQISLLCERFRILYSYVRITTIPSSAYGIRLIEELGEEQKKNEIFCVYSSDEKSMGETLRELLQKHPRNRVLSLSDRYGCCMNGYLQKK